MAHPILDWFKRIFRVPDPFPPAPPTPPVPTAPPPTSATVAAQLLAAHNAIRSRAGVAPLTWSTFLENSASGHSAWMAAQGDLTHDGDGTPQSRAIAAGYPFAVGENAARGTTTVDATMALWEFHPVHYENIINPNYVTMGGAVSGAYWTCDFGTTWPVAQALRSPRPRYARSSYSCDP